MPHGLGAASCSGNCSSGEGVLRSQYVDLEYEGRWQSGRPMDGLYAIRYKGQEYFARYEDGRPVEGTKFYPHGNFELDYFTGEWQKIYDPFAQQEVTFPYRGIYHSITGATLTGEFFAIPSRGMLKSVYEKNPDAALNMAVANVIFVGQLAYKGQKEVTTLARKNYFIGSPLMGGGAGGLQPSDAGMLVAFKRELESEQAAQERASHYAKQNSFNFSDVIALAATVAATSYGVSAGLTSDSAAYLGHGAYKLVAEGDASGLSGLDQNLEFEQQKQSVNQDIQEKVAAIERDYARPNRQQPASQRAAEATKRLPSATVELVKPVRAPKKELTQAETPSVGKASVELETSGSTGMFFPYEQALDLAETKAANAAHALCRQDYGGRLLSDSGSMAKKECRQHTSREEYKCDVSLIFTCERR